VDCFSASGAQAGTVDIVHGRQAIKMRSSFVPYGSPKNKVYPLGCALFFYYSKGLEPCEGNERKENMPVAYF